MFKDRRVLMERDLEEHKSACGKLYFKIVSGQSDANDHKIYASMKERLSEMITELLIVDQMIKDGHE